MPADIGRTTVWIGLDLGTRGVRAAAYGTDGRLVAEASVDRPPDLSATGRMTHEPERDWWGGSIDALAAVIPGLTGYTIGGIGLAGLFPAVALVDADGVALTEGILYGDTRAAGNVAAVQDAIGVHLSGDEVSPRMVWWRDAVLR